MRWSCNRCRFRVRTGSCDSYDDAKSGGNGMSTFSYPNYFDYRAQNHSLDALASYRRNTNTLIGVGDAPAAHHRSGVREPVSAR